MASNLKSASTAFSYTQDIRIAVAFFGPKTRVATIVPTQIDAFNTSDAVIVSS